MPEKDEGKSKYERTLRALVLRDIMAGKGEIDGNVLDEEARRIVNEGGTVKIVTQPETNIKSPQNTNVSENQFDQPK
ncbi:hypothetical protein MUP35_04620 [Patescibacteria group bacterium]|nr:hypothetical protein [Patescibacteria group bacterium]